MAKKTVVGGDVVRTWLREQGVQVGSRGRFSASQIEAFEKATKQRYETGHVPTRTIKGTRTNPETGRKTPVQVKATLPEVRGWATSPEGQAALGDVAVGTRGKLPEAVFAAFAARPKA